MGKLSKQTPKSEELNLDALPWNSSLSITNNLEGGFLSLEEIDESQYNLTIPDSGKEVEVNLKKRKRVVEDKVDDGNIKIDEEKKKKKKKKNMTKNVPTQVFETNVDELMDEDEFNAWHELRLHPLLMKEIYKLGFKQPTAIQKACIPAAAHQGKDVIGAAETGSGKTLAFGLPIFQRLLDEQEKVVNKQTLEDLDVAEIIAPRGLLRALIITPTRELALQVTDHLKAAAKSTKFRVVAIVGGMSTEKQERLLKARPEIIVGTPGRLWELMSGGEKHLVELHSLSFFVLDEADRMIENGHFHELQFIIDMLPANSGAIEKCSQDVQNCTTVSSFQRKKRQTLVFSATIALSADFRKKLKRGTVKLKQSATYGLSSLEALSERAGLRPEAAIFDLTSESIMTSNLVESFLECSEEDKDAYLYYMLRVHGLGRTIVFCSKNNASRHVAALLSTLDISVSVLNGERQQRARLKALDNFRKNKNGILVASDVAARGLDLPGVRMVIHYQLPRSAEVYVHRSGRTARASTDGCSILLVSSNERSKFPFLCKSFGKDTLQRFPIDDSYMPEVRKRLSLARQIIKISLKDSKEKVKDSWIKRNAESIGLDMEENDSEEERVDKCRQKKSTVMQLKKLQQELNVLLSRPLQPKSFSHRFLAGAGVSPMLQHQLEEIAQQKGSNDRSLKDNKRNLVMIGQVCVEPLQALRNRRAGPEACLNMNINDLAEKHRDMEKLRRKRKEAKKRLKQQKKTDKKRRK
ncbi:DEAD-box ATP-dependent RNA helicase 13-like isoform X2 [Amaranthus tricolor]|uniref:DEAD-box ATP-dependent RNA helicase 13-like isoform X2 n=1 Tax=Amaranthus tricolor TaxID=29722 RepID=UPI0025863A15|nr:DEAD-box ATP-dependent RNA helicase 13-like isoform X2 [Amaranthus tricolor]